MLKNFGMRQVRLALTAAAPMILVALLWMSGRLARAEPVGAAAPTPVEITVVGGPDLNPNSGGRASPVEVRIFDLAASTSFESADLQSLFERAGEVLKQDLVAQEEFILHPGDIQPRNRNLAPQVKVLGVTAAFRDVEHAIWRLTIPVVPGRRNFLLIDLDRSVIRLMPVDPAQP
jgi:type VI secretion system protein VasD